MIIHGDGPWAMVVHRVIYVIDDERKGNERNSFHFDQTTTHWIFARHIRRTVTHEHYNETKLNYYISRLSSSHEIDSGWKSHFFFSISPKYLVIFSHPIRHNDPQVERTSVCPPPRPHIYAYYNDMNELWELREQFLRATDGQRQRKIKIDSKLTWNLNFTSILRKLLKHIAGASRLVHAIHRVHIWCSIFNRNNLFRLRATRHIPVEIKFDGTSNRVRSRWQNDEESVNWFLFLYCVCGFATAA